MSIHRRHDVSVIVACSRQLEIERFPIGVQDQVNTIASRLVASALNARLCEELLQSGCPSFTPCQALFASSQNLVETAAAAAPAPRLATAAVR